MSKDIHTPRDELVCGKIDKLDDMLRAAGDVEGVYLLQSIQNDCERMEKKLISRKDEVIRMEAKNLALSKQIVELNRKLSEMECKSGSELLEEAEDSMYEASKQIAIAKYGEWIDG